MSLSSPRIVGLGMACLDILVRTAVLPTWEGGVRLDALAIDGGGPVATALVAAQRLGIQTGFVGTYGSDRLGEIKLQTLLEHGVDVSHAVQRSHPENQAVLVTVNSDSGERVFSGTHVPAQLLSPDELDRAYITSADVLHLDGYHSQAALQAALWMKAAGKSVMLDGGATHSSVGDEMVTLIRQVDFLICGSGFAPAVTGYCGVEAGEALLALGPRVVIQTEGEDGCYITTPEGSFHTPAFSVDVVDTTGAGDVFHGAFLVGLLKGWSLPFIVQFSSAVAALKCTRLGGRQGIPSFEETLHFLSEHGISLS
jgi:sulfofructose kinase